MKIVPAFFAILLGLLVTGCQTSQVATSSFSGDQFSGKPVAKRVAVRQQSANDVRAARLARQAARKEAAARATRDRVRALERHRIAVAASLRSSKAAEAARERALKLRRASLARSKALRIAKREKAKAVATKKRSNAFAAAKTTNKRKSVSKRVALKRKPAKASRKATVKRTAAKKRKPVAKKRRVASKKSARKNRKVARKSSRSGRYRSLIARHARANGVPVSLAMAVVQVESNYRANARGRAGEIGLMQIMPRTARYIGYKGSMRKLYNPDTNIRYGMKYLGKAYRLGGRSTCGAILKYNAGHGAKRMNPISREYCRRVKRILRRG